MIHLSIQRTPRYSEPLGTTNPFGQNSLYREGKNSFLRTVRHHVGWKNELIQAKIVFSANFSAKPEHDLEGFLAKHSTSKHSFKPPLHVLLVFYSLGSKRYTADCAEALRVSVATETFLVVAAHADLRATNMPRSSWSQRWQS